MSIALTNTAKNARLAGLRDQIDNGSGTAAINLYAGARPALDGAPAGALLVSVPLPVPCGTVAGGVLTLSTPSSTVVAASGTIAWARLVDRSGATLADMDCGITGSGADVELNTLDVISGGLLAVTNGQLRE